MRIGINCLALDPQYVGGVSSYTFGLLGGFKGLTTAHDFVIICNKENQHLFAGFKASNKFKVHVVAPYNQKWKRRLLWQSVKLRSLVLYDFLSKHLYFGLSKEIDCLVDVVYTPTTVLFPLHSTKPQVLSMHDIQQIHFPNFFSRAQLNDRYVTYTLSAKHCTILQASSQFIREDFLKEFSFLKPQNVPVIPEGVNIELFRENRNTNSIYAKYGLPQKFLFYPAQLWPHKDHITLLKALLEIKKKHNETLPLVLTGASYGASENVMKMIQAEGMATQVYYLGKIPYEDIIALFKEAYLLLSASLHESNCLTVLESAAAGTPVLVSDIPPNKELSLSLQIDFFETQNNANLAEKLWQLWNNNALLESKVAHNSKAIEQFSWEVIAGKYMDIFEQSSMR